MSSAQEKIDREIVAKEQQYQERSRKEAEKVAAQRAKPSQFDIQRAKELKELGNRFKCHCCGARAQKPLNEYTCPATVDWCGYEDNWHKPGDLFSCSGCDKLTCQSCLDQGYRGYCKCCVRRR